MMHARRLFPALFGALMLSPLFSQAAHAEDQLRKVPEFDSIRSKIAFNVSVEVGQPQSITIKGSDRFQNQITTEVIGRELVISFKEKTITRVSDEAQVIVHVPQLNRLRSEGAGAMRIKNINSPDFRIDYEGVGLLTASGRAQTLWLSAKGVGMVDTRELIADQVDARVEGIGSVTVYAKDKLNASVQGIGSLTYYGNPRSLSKSVDGIGSVRAGGRD